MNNFLMNLFEVDQTSFQVMALMCSAGVFLMQQTTEKTAASLVFYPILLLCALAVRSAGIPAGIYFGMEEGEFIVFTTTIGMCVGLGLFAVFSRLTSTAT
ncbi:MAG: hypothetical protein R3D57_18475 [Hyphomicrobiaceae bacterium]